jgi:hypothetical protein
MIKLTCCLVKPTATVAKKADSKKQSHPMIALDSESVVVAPSDGIDFGNGMICVQQRKKTCQNRDQY